MKIFLFPCTYLNCEKLHIELQVYMYYHSTADQAVLLDKLQHLHSTPRPQADCETWACPWNYNGSMFAWLVGHKLVTIVFWDKSLRGM